MKMDCIGIDLLGYNISYNREEFLQISGEFTFTD
jgi:hypothetical protein